LRIHKIDKKTPFVIKYFDSQINYLILERFGENLFIFFEKYNCTKEFKLQITRQICSAIEYLHRRNIMHGNLNPKNILVYEKAGINIKLCNFENAMYIETEVDIFSPNIDNINKEFVSPEVYNNKILENNTIYGSLAIDIFHLGLIFGLLFNSKSFLQIDENEFNKSMKNQKYLSFLIQSTANAPTPAQCSNHESHNIYNKKIARRICRINPNERYNIGKVKKIFDLSEEQYISKQLTDIQKNIISIKNDTNETKNIVISMNNDIQNILKKVKLQNYLLKTSMQDTYKVPTLAVMFNDSDINQNNASMFNDTYRLYFVCSHTLEIVKCGPSGNG